MNDTTQPEKLPLTTLDIATEKREELRRLLAATFPEIMSEDKIDLDQLKRVLGEWVEPDRERFGLNWPGKAACMKVIQTPSVGTLKPCPGESVDWDTTQNVFIEGDNLEVLKLLQKAYFGKIKMIYIDPPYNTGKEFIYPDKYSESLDTYLEYTGQKDSEGRKFSTNTESSGRFHSRWLNMMYPRLYLAKNLLKQDGLIFVSVDDHEISSLRMMMDQIFGEENFTAQLVWNTEGHTDNQFDVKVMHEYILVYARDANIASLGFVVDPNTRTDSNLWRGFAENSITKNGPGNPPSEVNLPIGFPCKATTIDLPKTVVSQEFFDEVRRVGYISRDITKKYAVSYPIRVDDMRVEDGRLKSPCRVYAGWANVNKLREFIANECKPIKEDGGEITFFLSENGVIYYQRQREEARNIVSVLRNLGTTEKMRSELEEMGLTYQYPKPKELIGYLAKIGLSKSDVVLDFFAGSATVAQAIYELNVEQKSLRRFILVQLPEPIPETSLAFSLAFQNIAELAKERIRRAERKAGVPAGTGGFRSFKLDRSCFKAWCGASLEEGEASLLNRIDSHAEHIDAKAQPDDILFELLLKDGFQLTTAISTIELAGKKVFSVADGALLICLDKQLSQEVIDAMADMEPSRVICLDVGFQGNDQLKANAVQTFKARARNRETAIEFRTV
jgi:adenine-specific DNA-methyltransferase